VLDFAQIKKTPITDVLSWLGITLREDGEQLRGHCPISGVVAGRAPFIVTPAKNAFICFCAECKKLPKQGGDCIELVARLRKIPAKDAAGQIAAQFQGAGKPADKPSEQQEPAPQSKSSGFDPLAYQQTLDPYHDALADFDQGAIKELGGGYSSKGLNRARLVLPVHGQSGVIEAFVGIALKGEEPRLQFPKDFKVPYFLNPHMVGEGTLYIVNDPVELVNATASGMTNVLVVLHPLTTLCLCAITALMKTNKCTELELLI